MGEMNWADLRGNELPFLILFEIGEEGTPRQIFSNIRHNFSANELASATVQSFEHKKWNPLYERWRIRTGPIQETFWCMTGTIPDQDLIIWSHEQEGNWWRRLVNQVWVDTMLCHVYSSGFGLSWSQHSLNFYLKKKNKQPKKNTWSRHIPEAWWMTSECQLYCLKLYVQAAHFRWNGQGVVTWNLSAEHQMTWRLSMRTKTRKLHKRKAMQRENHWMRTRDSANFPGWVWLGKFHCDSRVKLSVL